MCVAYLVGLYTANKEREGGKQKWTTEESKRRRSWPCSRHRNGRTKSLLTKARPPDRTSTEMISTLFFPPPPLHRRHHINVPPLTVGRHNKGSERWEKDRGNFCSQNFVSMLSSSLLQVARIWCMYLLHMKYVLVHVQYNTAKHALTYWYSACTSTALLGIKVPHNNNKNSRK